MAQISRFFQISKKLVTVLKNTTEIKFSFLKIKFLNYILAVFWDIKFISTIILSQLFWKNNPSVVILYFEFFFGFVEQIRQINDDIIKYFWYVNFDKFKCLKKMKKVKNRLLIFIELLYNFFQIFIRLTIWYICYSNFQVLFRDTCKICLIVRVCFVFEIRFLRPIINFNHVEIFF